MSLRKVSETFKAIKLGFGKAFCDFGLHLDRAGSVMTNDVAYLSTTSRHKKLVRMEGILPSVSNAFVPESACLVGEVYLGSFASVGHQCTLRGETNAIRVGNYSSIGDLTVLNGTSAPPKGVPGSVNIGNNVVIGSKCTVFSSIIDDNVVIGDNVIIGEGSKIERGAVIEANSVVAPGSLVLGNKRWAGENLVLVEDLSEADQFANYEKSYSIWEETKKTLESIEKGKNGLSSETQQELEKYLTINYFKWRARYY